jgi:hypothetical protein
MAIIKDTKKMLIEERRKNEVLEAALAKEKSKVQFLALLTADIDIDELMEEDE